MPILHFKELIQNVNTETAHTAVTKSWMSLKTMDAPVFNVKVPQMTKVLLMGMPSDTSVWKVQSSSSHIPWTCPAHKH